MHLFKERLVTRRNALGWTQVVLAEKSGVAERTIAGFESKGNEPSADILRKLADTMGVTRSWLLGEDPHLVLKDEEKTSPQTPASSASPYSWIEISTLEKTLADLAGRLQKCSKQDRKHILGNIVEVVNELENREINSTPLSGAAKLAAGAAKRDQDERSGGSSPPR